MCTNSRLCCNIRFLIVYSVSIRTMTRLLCQLDLTHIRCDARAHNRSIATAHQPRRPLFAPYASATSTDPTETLPKASPDTAPPLRTPPAQHTLVSLSDRKHGIGRRPRTDGAQPWAPRDAHLGQPVSPCRRRRGRHGDLWDARRPIAPRLAPAGGSGSGMEIRARGDGIDQRGR